MMPFETLTDSNLFQYALSCYDNPGCQDVSEFEDDLNRIKYVHRLMRRDSIDQRTIMLMRNHIRILYNVFGTATTRMLFLKIDSAHWSKLKAFLLYFSYLPERVEGINGKTINTNKIKTDQTILRTLENL